MVQHLVDRHRERIFVAEHGHGQRVPNQHHIDTGFIHQPRARIVVGGQAGYGLVLSFSIVER